MTNTPSRGVHLKYRPDIDGLRAIAVLAVVGFHAFPKAVKAGFIGVDIFFVISGYLISTIVFSNLERESFSILDFYNRRIRRIFPALIAVMLASIAFGWFALFADEYRQLGKHIAAGAAFLSNVAFYRESGYFDNASETKPMLHLWSLAIEEQFYLFWPLLLAFVWKCKWSFIRITSAIAILSFAVDLYLLAWRPSAAFYWPFSRFWELMIGGLLAYIALHRVDLLQKHGNVRSTIGATLLALGFLLIDRDSPFPGWWTLLPTIGAFLLISAGSASWFNRHILSNRMMVWVGLISYPLYLWHWPLFSFTNILSGSKPPQFVVMCAVALSFLLAWLTYLFIERPARTSPSKKTALVLLAAMLVLCVSARVVSVKAGFPQRSVATRFYNSQDILLFDQARYSDDSCAQLNRLSLTDEEICLSNSKSPEVLFAGDSHAVSLYSAIHYDRVRVNSILIAGHGCSFYPNLQNTAARKDKYGNNCTAIANKVIETAREIPTIKTVVLQTIYPYKSGDSTARSTYQLNGHTLTKGDAFDSGTQTLIGDLLGEGKNVIFVIDVPILKFDPRDCIQRLSFVAPKKCEFRTDEYNSTRKDYLEAVYRFKVKFPSLIVFDPTSEFCYDGWCHFREDNQLLYFDFHHINILGSQKVLSAMQADDFLPANSAM